VKKVTEGKTKVVHDAGKATFTFTPKMRSPRVMASDVTSLKAKARLPRAHRMDTCGCRRD